MRGQGYRRIRKGEGKVEARERKRKKERERLTYHGHDNHHGAFVDVAVSELHRVKDGLVDP